MERKLMDDKEVAEYTGLSRWSINEMRRRGTIPYIKLPNIRKFYFEQSAIDHWLESLAQGPRQEQTYDNVRKLRA